MPPYVHSRDVRIKVASCREFQSGLAALTRVRKRLDGLGSRSVAPRLPIRQRKLIDI